MPKILGQMGVFSNFVNNFNIMLMVFYGYFVLLVIVNILASLLCKQEHKMYCRRALMQGMVTLALFNCFNFSFAAGVHWKYASPASDPFYALGCALSILTFAVVAGIVVATVVVNRKILGEFRTKFKEFPSQFFIPLTIVYRMALGVFCAIKNDYEYGTIFILGLSLCFTLYIIVNLPFTNPLENYRTALIQVTIIFILFTADYYRTMKSTTAYEVKGRIYIPAIVEIVLMGACIAASVVLLVQDVVNTVRECRKSKAKRRITLDTSEHDNQVIS